MESFLSAVQVAEFVGVSYRTIENWSAQGFVTKGGKLVAAEQVKQAWDNHNANCKAKLLSLPAKLALELSGIEEPEVIQVRLTEVIDEALLELAEGM